MNNVIDNEFTSPAFHDTREFATYAVAVLGVIRDAGRPVTLREIHAALGDLAKPRWTYDALEWITDSVDAVGILPTRYAYRSAKRSESAHTESDWVGGLRRYGHDRDRSALSAPSAAKL